MFNRLFNFFKKNDNKRSLAGARPTRLVNWHKKESYNKINMDLRVDLIKCQARCRDLAKNDPIVRSYLNLLEKNVIRKSRVRTSDAA